MKEHQKQSLAGELLDECELTLGELCRVCSVSEDRIVELVEEGIVDPGGRDPQRWRFRSISVRRVRCAVT